MEDHFTGGGLAGGQSGLFSSASGLENPSDGSNLNVLSSFLNSSREISNYQPHFSDILKNSYPSVSDQSSQPNRDADGVVPESSQACSSSSSPSASMATGQQTNKRKAPESSEEKDPLAEDKKAIKKQRRLAKNREAAQLFRQRQKEYISNLETRASQLMAANSEANARAELIASENKLMREQLTYLRNFMKQAVSFSLPYGMPNCASTPTSPAGLVPSNPFLTGLIPPPQLGVDAMGNFIDSTSGVGLPSSIPLADGTSISFNLVPSTAVPPPPFIPFLPISQQAPSSPLAFSPTTTNVSTTASFPHPHPHIVPDTTHPAATKDDKGELSPD